MKRLVAALACFALIFPAVRAEDAKPAPAKAIRVPFKTLASQHIIVPVKINGKGPYRLIFDTGAPVTLLNNRIAKAGGVFPKNFRRPFFALFGSMGDFKVKSLQVGGVEAHNVPIVVMDHPTVEFVSKLVGPIDGIVGFSFWGRYRVSIDYQAREMTFVPTTYQPPDLMQTILKTLTVGGGKAKTEVLAPAGQWGFRVVKEAKDAEPGVTVAEVLPGSPAAAAGLKAGDRLLVLNGRWTDSVADCYTAAAHVQPGTTARLTICREGKEREVTVHVQAGL
jgi:hypothetical protein